MVDFHAGNPPRAVENRTTYAGVRGLIFYELCISKNYNSSLEKMFFRSVRFPTASAAGFVAIAKTG
jgi:hypothetical protein